MTDYQKKYFPYIGVCLLYLLLAIINIDSGYDKFFDIWWSHDILHAGITDIYATNSVNYPPIVLYILYVFTLFFDHANEINLDTVNYLKPVKMFFDLIILFELIYFIKKHKRNIWLIFFFLANLGYWYNTLIWAQYDTMVGAFLIGAYLFAFEKKWFAMVICFVLALNTKHVPIIFFPVLFLITAKEIKWDFKHWAKLIGLAVSVQLFILIPFALNGKFSEAINSIFFRTVSHHDAISLYAHNIWYFLFEHGDPRMSSDKLPFWGLNYFKWGFIFFFSFYLLIMIKPIIELFKKKSNFFTSERMLLLSGLTGIAFYYFNVEMHERYLHIPLILLGFYAVISRQWIAFAFLSFVFFCTLESVMQALEYLNLGIFSKGKEYLNWFIFNRKFMAFEVTICLAYYSYLYFRDLNKVETNK